MVVVLRAWLFFHSSAETDEERDHREAHQRADLPLRRGFREQTESSAGVLHVGQMEEAGNDRNAVVQRDIAGHRPLRQAIQQQHDGCDQEKVLAHGLSGLSVAVHVFLLDAAAPQKEAAEGCSYRAPAVASISDSTALQRSHTVGYALSSPTCVE